MRNILKATLILITVSALTSCGGTEKAEGIAAEIEAAQMEGRNDARAIINRQWPDTVRLNLKLDEARARKQEMVDSGYLDRAAAYDSTFVSTIRTVRPDLKNKIRL